MKKYLMPAVLAVCFLIFTILVKCVDVQAVGPGATLVGFASLNVAVHNLFSGNAFCYMFTQILGLAAIGLAAIFAIIGIAQLIKRNTLMKVDRTILMLGVVYIAVILLYILFEKLAINFRPILGKDGLEASYPSTHTMLILTVFGTAHYALCNFIKNKSAAIAIRLICYAIMAAAAVCRLVSGVHWFTDIIGSILVSSALISFYHSAAIKKSNRG